MKKFFTIGLFLVLALATGAALAAKPGLPQNARKAMIPASAVQVAPSVYYLGQKTRGGEAVEGFAFVHHSENYAKGGNGGGRGGGASSCYAFLAKGAKWKALEPYIVNPWNTKGLSESFVMSNLAFSIGKWEAAAGIDLLGDGNATNETLEVDFDEPDGLNEAYFGDVAQNGAIAITVVWGVFGGSVGNRKLIEWDMVFDQVDFDWSASGEPNKMDFENIATHELGHGVGLNDLYDNKCSEQTMYGYAVEGETKKRSLESGDAAGVKALYA
ncbi:MAG: matrixin family metalloprotease [Candidatus Norongarragalinales archaeon]